MTTDVPTDTLPVWVGLGVASVALLGVALALPTGVPDATRPARTVDEVAASAYDASATTRFETATRVELRADGLDRCRDETCAHASFVFGPVTPVAPASPLAAVGHGAAPEQVFDSPGAFSAAVAAARNRDSVVVRRATRLTARHVTWGGTDVTLVSA